MTAGSQPTILKRFARRDDQEFPNREIQIHLVLADRDDFAEDTLSATFHMQPGAKFHDRSAVEATDFAWSYNGA